MIPGEILLSKENIIINEGKETVSLVVTNDGDRLIGVGSHEHFLRSIVICCLRDVKHTGIAWIFWLAICCSLSLESIER